MRNLYEAMVDRANTPPNMLDGSTAMRAVPAKKDKTMLEELGLVSWSTADQYSQVLKDRIIGYKHPGYDPNKKLDWDFVTQNMGREAEHHKVAAMMRWPRQRSQEAVRHGALILERSKV